MKKENNAIIITAKGGNQSIGNKNIVPILGKPLVEYPIAASKNCTTSENIYLSTENSHIKKIATQHNIHIIDRPALLATEKSEHKDVIKHAVEYITSINPEIENFVVLLGNTVMTTSGLIDKAFSMLHEEDCDSVVSAWKAQDDHPYRALRLSEEGYVTPFLNVDCSSNRQSYPDVFFYDQGVWAFKKQCALLMEGPKPWVWLGKKCKMIERLWVTGRDVHSWIDLSASSWYLTQIQPYDQSDYSSI